MAEFQLYLSEIAKTPLLSAAEEKALAQRIAQGDPVAREHLVKANLRLVVKLARHFVGRGVSLEDLVQEGNLGLIRAVELFDGTREFRFSGYASYWIKQSIQRAITFNGKPVRIPAYLPTLMRRWHRMAHELGLMLNRPVTNREIGQALRLSRARIAGVENALRIRALKQHDERFREESFPLEDYLCDPRSRPADELLAEAENLARLPGFLAHLDDRSAEMIRVRFGLDGNPPKTLREVGKRFGVTRERARQIIAAALLELAAEVAA